MTSTTLVEVPVPGVVVLIGPAGSGKSTFAATCFAPDDVLSSDQLREVVSGDATDQSVTRVAFGILHRELARRLRSGRLVVVDATSLTRSSRAALVWRATSARMPAVAVVLSAPADVVRARNAGRPGRAVPADVVNRQLVAAAALGAGPAAIRARLLAEGFADVHVIDTDRPLVDAFAITVVRRIVPA